MLRLAFASFLLVTGLLAGGCSLLGGDVSSDLTDVADSIALFHFKVPADWQTMVESGLIAISAGEEPLDPAQEKLDRFWMLVYTSEEPSDTPVAENLTYLIEQRAELREWTDLQMDEPVEAKVGDRDAAMVSATATDFNGIDFEARYYFVRTKSNEVLIVTMAPAGTFDEYAEEVDAIVGERWFWASTAGSAETSETADE
jgi:hypothetical protein